MKTGRGHVIENAQNLKRAGVPTVRRDESHPGPDDIRSRPNFDSMLTENNAAGEFPSSTQTFHQFIFSRPWQAADTEDFAYPKVKANIPEQIAIVELANYQGSRWTRFAQRFPVKQMVNFAANHLLD